VVGACEGGEETSDCKKWRRSVSFWGRNLLHGANQLARYVGTQNRIQWKWISMFHRAFFNSIIDKYQHMHFFTFNTVLV